MVFMLLCPVAIAPHLITAAKVNVSSRCHILSPHLNSPQLTPCHLTWSHLISSHLIPSHLISSHFVSSHLISSHLISSHLISFRLVSSRLVSSRLVSSRLVPYQRRVISNHLSCELLFCFHFVLSPGWKIFFMVIFGNLKSAGPSAGCKGWSTMIS